MGKRKATDDGNITTPKIPKTQKTVELPFSDIKLIVGSTTFEFRKGSLYDNSIIFKTMFDDCDDENEIDTLTLDDDPIYFQCILDLIRDIEKIDKIINCDNFYQCFMIADKYEMKNITNKLFDKCKYSSYMYNDFYGRLNVLMNYNYHPINSFDYKYVDTYVRKLCKMYLKDIQNKNKNKNKSKNENIPQIFWLKCAKIFYKHTDKYLDSNSIYDDDETFTQKYIIKWVTDDNIKDQIDKLIKEEHYEDEFSDSYDSKEESNDDSFECTCK
jgi:hypothetical protein